MKTDEIEKLLAEAKPGPWIVRTLENFGWNVVHYLNGDKFKIYRVSKSNDEADARLIAMAPDLAAEVVRLRAEKEGTYARGFHDAQEKAKVEGRLTIIDSPKLAQMRAILKDCDGALKALGIPEDAEPRASARAALEGRA